MDDWQRNAAPQQIPGDAVIIRRFRRQLKRQALFLDLFMLHRDVSWAFSAQHLHGFYEADILNVDKIIQC